MAWPPTTHQDVQDAVTGLRGTATDRVYYVAKSGSDSNNGTSWGTPFLTVAAALTAAGVNPCLINVGAGTFTESGLVIGHQQNIVGAGRYATILSLAANGTLVNLVNQSDGSLQRLGLQFASAAITGNLVYLSNSFRFEFFDVRFVSQNTAGQYGTKLDANAGDSHFIRCEYWACDHGIDNATTVNYWDCCTFVKNTHGYYGGDPTGASHAAGAVITNSTFLDTGTTYVNIAGTAAAHHFEGCWFDGAATTAISVGSGSYGPWLLTIRDCPNLAGATTSLLLNAADLVELDGVLFGNTGSNPTELSIPTPTNVFRGRIAACATLQTGHILESLVPASWDGYTGYATSSDGTVDLIETTKWYRVNYTTGKTQRKIVVRMNGRTTGTAAATLTFPSGFETGTYYATFNNSGITPTITATSITIPTGAAISDKLIILEGF